MKYAALFVALMFVGVALRQIGKQGRVALWRASRPYLLMAMVIAMAVFAVIQIALSGGSLRIL